MSAVNERLVVTICSRADKDTPSELWLAIRLGKQIGAVVVLVVVVVVVGESLCLCVVVLADKCDGPGADIYGDDTAAGALRFHLPIGRLATII